MSDYEHQAPCPSKAAIKGHPIHPMVIPFPIAFLAVVPVTDLVFAVGGEPFWARASYYLLWAGVTTGALAAVVGLIDFATIKRVRAHRHGWLHAGANAAALAVAVVNALVRAEDVGAVIPSGLMLSIVGSMLLVVGGWYGGELAYRYKIGVVGHEKTHRSERLEASTRTARRSVEG